MPRAFAEFRHGPVSTRHPLWTETGAPLMVKCGRRLLISRDDPARGHCSCAWWPGDSGWAELWGPGGPRSCTVFLKAELSESHSHVIVKPETLPALLQASSQAWALWLPQRKANPSPFHSPAPLPSGSGARLAQGGQRVEGPPSPCPTPQSLLPTGRAATVGLAGSELG